MAILKTANTSGKYNDDYARLQVISYILSGTTQRYCHGLGVDMSSAEAAAEDMRLLAAYFNKDSGVRLHHFILSFGRDEMIGKQKLGYIAWEITAYLGNDYQVVSAAHVKADNLHIHFVINSVNKNTGQRYSHSQNEFLCLQRYIRDVLRPYGINRLKYAPAGCYELD